MRVANHPDPQASIPLIMNKFTLLATALAGVVFASGTAQANIVADPSFELGDGGTSPWTQASSNFGTPLCTVGVCGTGNGSGPRTGDWWAWFGGSLTLETGSVSQSITLLDGTSTLSFWFENTIAASTQDFIEARIDGNTVWRYDAGGALSGLGGYSQITVDLSTFGAGARLLEFYSVSGNNGTTNFFVDDVSVVTAPVPEPATYGLMALGLAGLMLASRRSLRG
jgi:hypothetical protein